MQTASSQIIYGQLLSVAREMAATLARLSRSPLIAEDGAFAVGILDRELRLVVQQQGEATHLYAVRDTARVLMDYYAYDVSEGDVFIIADPFFGGTHGHVLSIVSPIFWLGQLEYVAVYRIPVLDLAGELPGALQPFAFEVWQEAYRITPMRLYRAGALQKDVARFLSVNTRAPASLNAEIEAALAVGRTTERDLKRLIQKYGVNALNDAAQIAFAYTAKRIHDHLRRILPRSGSASRSIPDPAGNALTINITLKWQAATVLADFTASSSMMLNSLNATRQLTSAAAALPLMAAILDDLPINEGVLNSMNVLVPEKSIVNAAAPAACSLSVIITAHVIAAAASAAARDAGASAEDLADVHGIAPSAVLYPPVGTSSTTIPLYLSPGFCLGPSRVGGPALNGPRTLVSAEELEARYGWCILQRELTETGDMAVNLIYRGADCEATLVALGPLSPGDAVPAIRHYGARPNNLSGSAAVASIANGEHLHFFYPSTRSAA